MGIGTYKRSVTCGITVLVKLEQVHFDSELAASFENGATEKDILRKTFSISILMQFLRQLSSDTCSSKKEQHKMCHLGYWGTED